MTNLTSDGPRNVGGLTVTEHQLTVPLDHWGGADRSITIFAREVADPGGLERPILLYLQGGPGHEAFRPTRHPWSPGWLEGALKDYRVLMLDQRGTGRSTPVGLLEGLSPSEQAEHLTHFRADSIVADAECLRRALGIERWSLLGQSFGGFCVLAYLSQAPVGVREAFITGGLPPIGGDVDLVYEATYERMLERNRRFYAMFPNDRGRVEELHQLLEARDVRLPGGDRLTSHRVQQLGIVLGMSDGAEKLHYLMELPYESPAFLRDVEAALGFARNPLYAIIHEACYADGVATRWSADRVRPAVFRERPELFTGEHVFPWMFDEYSALRPLKEAADLLAEHKWPRLYNEEALAHNEVPVAAAVFVDDAYVERSLSEATAAKVQGLRAWITSEYQHNALGVDGRRVLERLRRLVSGVE